MNIVILDGYTCNPGDLSWSEFEALGTCAIYDRTPEPEVAARARDAEVVITNKALVGAAAINALPNLRYIGVMATGYNIVDVIAARARNIPVCNVPEYGTASVAQAAFALLLELTNHAGHHAQTVAAGRWVASPDFCYWDFPTIELDGLTLGIVGYGRIGQAVGRIAQAFGMRVIATGRQNATRRQDPQLTEAEQAELLAWRPKLTGEDKQPLLVSLEILFRESDVISLHCPLTDQTRQLISAKTLAQMKQSALLLNTARGGLVNEPDLAAALNEGRLAGAGLDVLSVEPPAASNPLLKAKNCVITPHVAWASRPARSRLMHLAAENLRCFLDGHAKNVVNSELVGTPNPVHPNPMPTRGQCYTREEIAAAHGGSTVEYLPNVSGRVVCACLRTEPGYNPGAPRVILPGRGQDIERWAGVLCGQHGPIPIYLKRVPNAWEHVGYYEVESFSQSPSEIARYEAQTGRAVTRVIYMREANEKKDALFKLAENVRSHENWWLFPAQDSIQGFMGMDPIFFVGDQPSNSEFLPSHPNRMVFYEHLERVGVPNAHLTDLYKKRGKSGTLRAGLPNDFHAHVSLFRREIEILQPTRIVALGHLAHRLLMQHVPEQRPILRRMWHFSYVARFGKHLQYEADMRRAIWGDLT